MLNGLATDRPCACEACSTGVAWGGAFFVSIMRRRTATVIVREACDNRVACYAQGHSESEGGYLLPLLARICFYDLLRHHKWKNKRFIDKEFIEKYYELLV